jgi:hypothetical protein
MMIQVGEELLGWETFTNIILISFQYEPIIFNEGGIY